MQNSHYFESLNSTAHSDLGSLATAVQYVVPISVQAWQFSTASLAANLPTPEFVGEVKQWAKGGNAFLYYFRLTQNTNLKRVEAPFAAAKARERKERAYARLNEQKDNLYVGSSQDIGKRILEHLGFGQSKTYSLQLAHWSQELALQIELVCARYENSTSEEVMQALEDALWNQLTPMFGRRGRR